jgi:chromosome segregation ATPase
MISEINKKGKELQYMYDRTNEEKEKLKGEIAAKEMTILNLQIEIENIKSSNDLLIDKNESNLKTQIIDLNKKIEEQNKTIKEINEKYVNATIEIGQLKKNVENKFRTDNINDDMNSENEMLKRENEDLKEKIENLKFMLNSNNNMGANAEFNAIINDDDEEKQLLKLQIEELRIEYNDIESKYNKLLNNNNTNNINNINDNDSNENKIKELEKQNEKLKKLNSSLVARLEIKGLKRSKYYDNKSENDKFTISDEEYDLKKMAHGAKEKNNSLDLNIDYPGYQTIKEKYRELDFYYTTLEYYARKLLQTIQETEENKTFIEEIRKIINK